MNVETTPEDPPTTPGPMSPSGDQRMAYEEGIVPAKDSPESVFPAAPEGLKAGGLAVWTAVVRDFDLRADEVPLLVEYCSAVDECAALREVLAQDGLTTAGSKGQTRSHPVLASLNSARATMLRLKQELQITDEDEEPQTPAQRKAQTAARARWQGHVTRREWRRADA